MTDYIFGTKPYAHQLEAFTQSRDEAAFALLMEQGTGKTKVAIDTAAWLFAQGKIDLLIVVAPNGVHLNWTEREVPTHIPDWCPFLSAYYRPDMNKAERTRMDALIKGAEPPSTALRVAAFSIDTFSYKDSKGFKLVEDLLRWFRVLLVIDESSRIKTPSATRTKALIKLGKRAAYRRIMTGTPYTQSPLDIWAPFMFLNPQFLGQSSFVTFRYEFADTVRHENKQASAVKGRPVFYEEVTGYRNLDVLKSLVAPHSYRVLKKDCLDLPPKVYERRIVELTKDQRRMYDEMAENSVATLVAQTGTAAPANLSATDKLLWYIDHRDEFDAQPKVVAQNAAVKLMRLQQIVGGFPEGVPIPSYRIQSLMEVLEEGSCPTIIWSRFVPEIEAIMAALCKEYGEGAAVAYYGGVKPKDREAAVNGFNAGKHRFFVSQQHAGGIGLTLNVAPLSVYYSNDFSLEARLQSEDRNHRIGQEADKVTYVDLEAPGLIDSRVLDALMKKQTMADIMNAVAGN